MPGTKTNSEPAAQQEPTVPSINGPAGEVFTLAEAAAYLRLPVEEVLRVVREQYLPARQVGSEWRFLKSAMQDWLSQPRATGKHDGIWALAGAWKHDPHVEEMLQEIYRQRGRPMTED
jgi:excisionase family DNA binding protein